MRCFNNDYSHRLILDVVDSNTKCYWGRRCSSPKVYINYKNVEFVTCTYGINSDNVAWYWQLFEYKLKLNPDIET